MFKVPASCSSSTSAIHYDGSLAGYAAYTGSPNNTCIPPNHYPPPTRHYPPTPSSLTSPYPPMRHPPPSTHYPTTARGPVMAALSCAQSITALNYRSRTTTPLQHPVQHSSSMAISTTSMPSRMDDATDATTALHDDCTIDGARGPPLIRDPVTGELLSGTPTALLQLLLPTVDYCPDEWLTFTLLLTLRSLTSPTTMLQRLLQHCMFEQNAALSRLNFRRENRLRLFEHVFTVCEAWTRLLPHDFHEALMRDRLLELFGLCRVMDAATGGTTQRRCDELMLELRSVLSKAERYANAVTSLQRVVEDPPQPSEQFPAGGASTNATSTGVSLVAVCPSAAVVAQQLAHIELERLSMIGAGELVDALAQSSSLEALSQLIGSDGYREERTTTVPTTTMQAGSSMTPSNGRVGGGSSHKRRSTNHLDSTSNRLLDQPVPSQPNSSIPQSWPSSLSNLRHYVDWFNQLSALVATEVMRYRHRRHRALAIDFWLEVARECYTIGNFNSLMAIIAALSLRTLTRLRRTWQRVEKVSRQRFDLLQQQLDPSGNFHTYRASLRAAIWRVEFPAITPPLRAPSFNNQPGLEPWPNNKDVHKRSGWTAATGKKTMWSGGKSGGHANGGAESMAPSQQPHLPYSNSYPSSSYYLVIPFFGLLMKDLFLLYRQGCPPLCRSTSSWNDSEGECTPTADGDSTHKPSCQRKQQHLNWAVMREFGRQAADLLRWQQRPCSYKKHSAVLQYLLLGATYSERNLLLLSYEYECPDTAMDKEEYRKLT